jgi:hypothetical protein
MSAQALLQTHGDSTAGKVATLPRLIVVDEEKPISENIRPIL